MSSWDRSRSIPWSRIQQGGTEDPDKYREQVFRELRREAVLEEERRQQEQASSTAASSSDGPSVALPTSLSSTSTATTTKNSGSLFRGPPYQTADLFKHALFGATLGSITGAVFGFMDGMRQAGESDILKKASSAAKGRFLFQGTTRSGMLFGAFFGGFHVIKYGVKVVADPGDATEIAVAGAASMGAIVSRPNARSSVPYAGMLVVMDAFNTYMSNNE